MKRIHTISLSVLLAALSLPFSAKAQAPSYQKTTSAAIEQQVSRKLRRLPNYGVFDHITFRVVGSTVILDGKVNSLGTRRAAAAEVRRIAGVTRVVNNIDQLPPSPMDDRIRRAALRTLAQHGLGGYFWPVDPDVRIIVERGRITLEGEVMNSGDYHRMNIYANGIPGVFKVTNNLVIGRDNRKA